MLSADNVALIFNLLPGFISAWIYYSFTDRSVPSPFERIVQALIFSTFTQAIVIVFKGSCLWIGKSGISFGTWSNEFAFVLSVLVAVLLGFVITYYVNTNRFHAKLPDWLTLSTSYPSQWYSTFMQQKKYIYLNLTGNRRIHGWPAEWPENPDKGHFVLMDAAWITENNERLELPLISHILIPSSEVLIVEFDNSLSDDVQTAET